jgi:beta-lactam-binding protein with PASTA domain
MRTVLLAMIAVLAVALAAPADVMDPPASTEMTALPRMLGLSVDEARDLVAELGRIPIVQEREGIAGPPGLVVDQVPVSGTSLSGILEVLLVTPRGEP